MKIKEMIDEAADMLGVDAPKKSVNRKILMRCANLTLSTIASNYYDCVKEETFEVTNGVIENTAYKETMHKIVDCNVPYEIYTGFIGVPNGSVTVKYAILPKYTRQDEEISKKCPLINESILLYGILANYASICTMREEERIFKRKFQDAIFGMDKYRSKRVKVMPCV
jgi:hypothetical protein